MFPLTTTTVTTTAASTLLHATSQVVVVTTQTITETATTTSSCSAAHTPTGCGEEYEGASFFKQPEVIFPIGVSAVILILSVLFVFQLY